MEPKRHLSPPLPLSIKPHRPRHAMPSSQLRPPIFFLLRLLIAAAASPLLFLAPTRCHGRPDPTPTPTPTPTPWPHQFHAALFMNNSGGSLQLVDLWYDWPNGRNLNAIRDQLSPSVLHDVEWDNGTSFFYTPGGGGGGGSCRNLHFEVGILRPDWLEGASYLGRRRVDGFLCDGWEKVDFIWYYEDVATKRPVYWAFFNGMKAHVMTFEVGAALEDAEWQAPAYCFGEKGGGDAAKLATASGDSGGYPVNGLRTLGRSMSLTSL